MIQFFGVVINYSINWLEKMLLTSDNHLNEIQKSTLFYQVTNIFTQWNVIKITKREINMIKK